LTVRDDDTSVTAETVDLPIRLMIDDLISDYAHSIDDDELERWPGFFTKDAKYKIIARENFDAGRPIGVMYCDGRGMMQDRINALRTANIYEPHTYCHVVGRTSMSRDGDIYRARTNFEVIRTMQDGGDFRFAVGKYVDEIVIEDGRVMFKSRVVVLESRRVDILLVIPL
jgi:anthranilate 1,2-dioxygenase small subunit